MKFRDILKEESETFHAQFISIVENLRSSYLSFATPVFYTSHGIDHSQNVENIADALISDHLKDKMNIDEIFILLCSIYFHDVGMALLIKDDSHAEPGDYFKKVDEARRRHSEKTASFMLHNYEEFGLIKPQAEIIARICRAHSDIKNEDGTKIYTFSEIMDRADVTNIDTVPIRIKYLASILRLSDELDVTARRAPGKRLKTIDLPFESQIEWMKHQIFSGVSINPNNWEIDLDVSESLLYGGGEAEEISQVALTNKLVTDVAIKIRKSLMEVKPPFLKEGVLYRKIRFRDPMIRKLEDIFKNYEINPDGVTLLSDSEFNVNYGSNAQKLLYEIENLELSPEYCISKTIDERLSQSINFFRNFESNWSIAASNTKINYEYSKKIQNSIIDFLGRYVKRRGFDGKVTYENDTEKYQSYLDAVGMYLFERGTFGEFNTELKFEITEVFEMENVLKKDDDTDLFIKAIMTDIMKDLFLHERRKTIYNKFKNHHYLHIIPRSFFDNLSNTSVLNPMERSSKISDFNKTLLYLKNLMDKSGGNFKFYYHNDNINLDYRIITSEVVLLPGSSQDSNMVVTETEAVIQFYDDFHKILRSNDTWLIEDIDTNNFQMKIVRDDKFQGSFDKGLVKREKIELELNTLILRAINGSTDFQIANI